MKKTLTNIPGARTLHFLATDEVPDTGHPVSQQREHGHEQREDHGAVLGVALQLLEQSQQTQQTHRLQQVDAKILKGAEVKSRHAAPRLRDADKLTSDVR